MLIYNQGFTSGIEAFFYVLIYYSGNNLTLNKGTDKSAYSYNNAILKYNLEIHYPTSATVSSLNFKIIVSLTFSGERPFICELCGNSYTDIKNLKKHKTKVHTGKFFV